MHNCTMRHSDCDEQGQERNSTVEDVEAEDTAVLCKKVKQEGVKDGTYSTRALTHHQSAVLVALVGTSDGGKYSSENSCLAISAKDL